MSPAPSRPDTELELLSRFLDQQRDAVLRKSDGLTREQLGQRLPPSSLTLAGLLNHLALVEDAWIDGRFLGRPDRDRWAGVDWATDPDWEFRTALELEPEELRRRYREAIERSRATVAAASGLDQLSAQPRHGTHFSLRWVLLHLIEETARHAGHADLIRESIDGLVGD